MTNELTGVSGTSAPHLPERVRAEASASAAAVQPVQAQAESHMSPTIHVDTKSGLATLEFRDRQTGEVLDEVPDPRKVKEILASYQNAPAQGAVQAPAQAAAVAATVEAKSQQPETRQEPPQPRPAPVKVNA